MGEVRTEVPREDQMDPTMHTIEVEQQRAGELDVFLFVCDRAQRPGVFAANVL